MSYICLNHFFIYLEKVLEKKVAEMFGKEASLFMPSGARNILFK